MRRTSRTSRTSRPYSPRTKEVRFASLESAPPSCGQFGLTRPDRQTEWWRGWGTSRGGASTREHDGRVVVEVRHRLSIRDGDCRFYSRLGLDRQGVVGPKSPSGLTSAGSRRGSQLFCGRPLPFAAVHGDRGPRRCVTSWLVRQRVVPLWGGRRRRHARIELGKCQCVTDPGALARPDPRRHRRRPEVHSRLDYRPDRQEVYGWTIGDAPAAGFP